MVKGVSRQVIVVHSPDPKLFEQAIFILKDDAIGKEGVTEDALLKEAKRLINGRDFHKKKKAYFAGPVWAFSGALLTGFIWLICTLF